MVKIALLWQAPGFIGLVWALMSFQDPFRLALCAAMLWLMDPVRRWILSLEFQAEPRISA